MKNFKGEIERLQLGGYSFMRHALGIGSEEPRREPGASVKSDEKYGNISLTENIRICKVPDCIFRKRMLCEAKSINIGWDGNHADCITFDDNDKSST